MLGPSRVKVDVRNSMFDLKHTPLFEWCMVEYEFESEHQKDMC